MMSVCELCIQSGLIPANEFYEELFRDSVIGAQIVDEQDSICYISDSAKRFDKKIMKMAKKQPVDLGKERLLAAKVDGGMFCGWMIFQKSKSYCKIEKMWVRNFSEKMKSLKLRFL